MEKSIEAVEQKEVEFYGDELTAIRSQEGRIYVSIRHMCEALGLTRQGQVRRIQRNEILLEGFRKGATLAPLNQRGSKKLNWLRVDLIPLWLTGIQLKNVRDEIRPKLKQYQKEAANVLWEAFQDGRLSVDPSFSELLKNDDNPSVQAYKMAQAMMRMAQQQIMLEARVDSHEERIEQLESIVGDTKHHITPSQASQISQAVKFVAAEFGKKTGRNEYAGVYNELYRRFEITGYKLLPKNRFDEAIQFLTGWYVDLTGDDTIPF